MSVSSSIDILLAKNVEAATFCKQVILGNFPLVNQADDIFGYAPLGYNYADEFGPVLPESELLLLIEQKAAIREGIVFSFYVQDEVSVIFHWSFENNTAGFALTGNRVCLPGTRWTDFSWYLNILLKAIGKDIISINCQDYH